MRTLLPFLRPYWLGFVPAVIGVLATSLVGLLKPWPLKFLIDDVLHVGKSGVRPDASETVIIAIALSIVGIAVLQGLLNFIKQFFLSATAQRVAFALRRALFAHMQRLPLTYHDKQRTGDMITRVTNDVTKVQELVTDDLLVGGATSILQLLGMLTVILFIDWQLGLVAAVSVPIIALTTAHYRGRIRAQENRVREKEGDIASLTQETMSSIRVVRAFGRAGFESKRFEEHSGEMLEAGLRVSRLEASMSWALNVAAAISLAALVGFGAHQVVAGALSAGTLVVFIQYMRDVQGPLVTLSKISTKIAKATVRGERIMEVLNERPAVEDRPDARPAPRFRGEVRFDHVSFGYSPERLVLRDINLDVKPGEVVAIVGPTGAGKSTLASLILRLYDPAEGAVLIDGHDIREYKLDSLVDQISVVLQESLLFQTTISENIAYGKPKARIKEIEQAARTAYCLKFIQGLPDGFDTVVGERGGTLSGGQRQRVAIARAVIRDAPILVLDEPTTGLDAESEGMVMRALERLMQGRTTVMITHKLSAVRRADRIYVLEHGSIVEEGTHEELMARGGLYARLGPDLGGRGEDRPQADRQAHLLGATHDGNKGEPQPPAAPFYDPLIAPRVSPSRLQSFAFGLGFTRSLPRQQEKGLAMVPRPAAQALVQVARPYPPWQGEYTEALPILPPRWLPYLRRAAETFLLAALILLSIRLPLQNLRAEDASMNPSLEEGEYLIVNKWAYAQIDLGAFNWLPFFEAGEDSAHYLWDSPARGDLIAFRSPRGELVSRIIGIPGDTVRIVPSSGAVLVNGQRIEEPYIEGITDCGQCGPWTVPAKSYFVMSDNRQDSYDSRQGWFVPKENIVGKALLTYEDGWQPNPKLAANHSIAIDDKEGVR